MASFASINIQLPGAGHFNFDFAIYDPAARQFFHANEGGPNMEVYRSCFQDVFNEFFEEKIFQSVFYCVACEHDQAPRAKPVHAAG